MDYFAWRTRPHHRYHGAMPRKNLPNSTVETCGNHESATKHTTNPAAAASPLTRMAAVAVGRGKWLEKCLQSHGKRGREQEGNGPLDLW